MTNKPVGCTPGHMDTALPVTTFAVATAGANPATTYTVQGDPQNSQTGQRHFCSDQSGVIRYDVATQIAAAGVSCAATASPLQ